MPLNCTETSVSQSYRAVYQSFNHIPIPTLIPPLQRWFPLRLNISRNRRFPGSVRVASETFCREFAVSASHRPKGTQNPNSLGPAHGLSLPQTALVAEPLLTAVTNRTVPASPFTEHGAQHNPHQSSWSVPFTAVCLGMWDSCLKTALNCLQTHTESISPNNEAE